MALATMCVNVRYRTIWISDVHLGTRQCDADAPAVATAATPR